MNQPDTTPHRSLPRSSDELQPGRIIANYGSRLMVEDTQGEIVSCHARKKLGVLVCGDKVQWRAEKDGNIIETSEPRQSELARPDAQGRKKVIAANVEQMLIITSPLPALNTGLIDRYLVAAETLAITPLIVLNKTDLLDKTTQQDLEQKLATYTNIGYQVLHTSTKQMHGLDQLSAAMHNQRNIFVGQSGVGKSSLINVLLPDAKARIGEVSQATNKGIHTTTTAWLYHLPGQKGAVIDSPGVREFGLWQIDPSQAAAGFREIREVSQSCRFRDCQHNHEPGCAVVTAVKNDEITSSRYDSYRRILASLEE